MRIVLVGWSEADWRTYRQPQWIGLVRRQPQASALPRRHFDIPEEGYRACLDEWKGGDPGASLPAALACLDRHGATAVAGPAAGSPLPDARGPVPDRASD